MEERIGSEPYPPTCALLLREEKKKVMDKQGQYSLSVRHFRLRNMDVDRGKWLGVKQESSPKRPKANHSDFFLTLLRALAGNGIRRGLNGTPNDAKECRCETCSDPFGTLKDLPEALKSHKGP